MMKSCSKCGDKFPATTDYFYHEYRSKDGLRSCCKKCYNKSAQEYYQNNREKVCEDARRYHEKTKNLESYRKYHRKYRREYCAEYPWVRVSHSVSCRIWKSIREGKGGYHWESLIGYSLDDLMAHLESQFKKGMTWNNYGRGGWHIDHIRPVSDFKFSSHDDPEFKNCWSLWNLQPLWERENCKKHSTCNAPPLPLLTSRDKD